MQHQETYRIMGIDPGTNYMGYGVLEIEGRNVRSVVLGDIDLHKLTDPYAKLRYIFERVKQSITGRGSAAKEQVAAIVCRILSIDQPPRRLDATDGMAVALCHHFTTASPLNTALGDERVKGLGGGKKAASKRGSQSWEKFLKDHPDREIK